MKTALSEKTLREQHLVSTIVFIMTYCAMVMFLMLSADAYMYYKFTDAFIYLCFGIMLGFMSVMTLIATHLVETKRYMLNLDKYRRIKRRLDFQHGLNNR